MTLRDEVPRREGSAAAAALASKRELQAFGHESTEIAMFNRTILMSAAAIVLAVVAASRFLQPGAVQPRPTVAESAQARLRSEHDQLRRELAELRARVEDLRHSAAPVLQLPALSTAAPPAFAGTPPAAALAQESPGERSLADQFGQQPIDPDAVRAARDLQAAIADYVPHAGAIQGIDCRLGMCRVDIVPTPVDDFEMELPQLLTRLSERFPQAAADYFTDSAGTQHTLLYLAAAASAATR